MSLSRSTSLRAGRPPRAGILAVLAAALSLTGCMSDNRIVQNPVDIDYKKTHPIVLTEGNRTIDVFVAGGAGAIGGRQIGDIRSFAQEYRRSGHGPLVVAMPETDPAASQIVPSIRKALAEAGVRAPVIAAYRPIDEGMAPVKLTFVRLKADVATQCGRYPDDLSGVRRFESKENVPYQNFGCSYQSALAQQVADPLDLVRGRPTSAPYAPRITTVLTKFGKGEPTAVVYPDEAKNKIDKAVGQ
jgi:pilus assembly protein CpaD